MQYEHELRNWLLTTEQNESGLRDIKWERSIYDAYAILSRDIQEQMLYDIEHVTVRPVGRIDLIFTYNCERYCSELKLIESTETNFWEALKILGYTALYNWQNNTKYRPAVMIPYDKIKLEHHIVARKLRLTIFSVKKIKENFSFKISQSDTFSKNHLKKKKIK